MRPGAAKQERPMAKHTSPAAPVPSRPELTPVPLLPHESVYIGIDIGKSRHVAGFLSSTLLARHERFEACPALVFENSREGFRLLLERIRRYCPLEHAFVLLERTGHYHRAVEQYLQELDIPVYVMQVQSRPVGLLKTDKRDALSLANQLYSQLELGVQVAHKGQLIRRLVPPTEAAAQLKGLIRHRYELIHESTRRKNKLTAICDELFPELTHVLKDPNAAVALAVRERYPTPHALATASLTTLRQLRGTARSLSDAKLLELQRLAAESIGTKDLARQRSLVLEQSQLIRELGLLREHIAQLETEITGIVDHAREGQILRSFPGIGPVMAGAMLAAIGSIHNFPSASALKAYFGWAPAVVQSGSTLDHARLTQGGTRTMKQILYLAVCQMTRQPETEWAQLYARLVKARCAYNERTQSYVGKTRVIGRVAGQLTEAIYALLKRDAAVMRKVLPGQEPPAPMLYDPAVHHAHRHGHYRPLISTPLPNTITILRPGSSQ
jgi:transposase